MALPRRRPGRRRPRVLARHDLHSLEQRPSLRDQRLDGTRALACLVVLALRASRVLLRDAHRRLRSCLHRQRRRLRLFVRSDERPPDLGAARRHVRLHGRGGVAQDGVRRDVGRLGRRLRRGNRQDALAPRLTRRCVRRADGDGRAALLRDARSVRGEAPAAGRARLEPDVRSRCANRQAASGASPTVPTRRSWQTAIGSISSAGHASTASRRRTPARPRSDSVREVQRYAPTAIVLALLAATAVAFVTTQRQKLEPSPVGRIAVDPVLSPGVQVRQAHRDDRDRAQAHGHGDTRARLECRHTCANACRQRALQGEERGECRVGRARRRRSNRPRRLVPAPAHARERGAQLRASATPSSSTPVRRRSR